MRDENPAAAGFFFWPAAVRGRIAVPDWTSTRPSETESGGDMARGREGPPFRADHVGSLLRPPELKDARERARRGELDRKQLSAIEDKCIREVVAFQESVGLQGITDGEFRRDWWHIDFLRGFDGVETVTGSTFGVHFQGADEQPPLMVVKSRIRRVQPSMLDHFR